MKIESKENSTIVLGGDVKSNKVSIKAEDFDFITMILSTNLYSNPINSFVRETVSNAWDSHVSAGVDEPIIIHIEQLPAKDKFGVSIMDFGTGISPEKFEEIYMNIGSSDKRGDDTRIGGFGIGRFSALSFKDVVNVTSFYEGIEYNYLMYRDGGEISIDLINTKDTDRENGVTVRVEAGASELIYIYATILRDLPFFENIIISTSSNKVLELLGDTDLSNKRVKYFNNFALYHNGFNDSLAVDPKDNKMRVLIGKVLYELDSTKFNDFDLDKSIFETNINLSFGIGEISVTPNRENIFYTPDNVSKIVDKIKKAEDELNLLLESQRKDFDDFLEYHQEIIENPFVKIQDGEDVYVISYPSSKYVTLNGEHYGQTNIKDVHKYLSETTFPAKFAFSQDSFRTTNIYAYARMEYILTDIKNFNSKQYFFERYMRSSLKASKIKNITKAFYRESIKHSSSYTAYILKDYTLPEFYIRTLGELERLSGSTVIKNYKTAGRKRDLFKKAVRSFYKRYQQLPEMSNNSVPNTWIEDYKNRGKSNDKSPYDYDSDITLYHYDINNSTHDMIKPKPVTYKLNELANGKLKKLVVYGIKGSKELNELAELINHNYRALYPNRNLSQDIEIVGLAKSRMNKVAHIDSFVHIKDFINNPKYKFVRDIGTLVYIHMNKPFYRIFTNVLKTYSSLELSKDFSDSAKYILDYIEAYNYEIIDLTEDKGTVLKTIYNSCKKYGWYNFDLKSKFDKYKDAFRELSFLEAAILGTLKERGITTFACKYCMKHKLLRPDYEALKKYKLSKIYDNYKILI